MEGLIDVVGYLPPELRTPDYQYQNLLRTIKAEGIAAKSFHQETSHSVMAPTPMRYNLRNGVPLGTERSMKLIGQSAFAEIAAFSKGKRTQQDLVAAGVSPKFWGEFVTAKKCACFGLEEGDLGPGSYGAAFANFPTAEIKLMVSKPNSKFKKVLRKILNAMNLDFRGEAISINQFKNVIAQIKKNPDLRTHFISPWIPQYCIPGEENERKVVVAPCHGWIHIRVFNGVLHLVMFQRAGDVPIGVPSNTFQYAVLTIVLAHVLDLKAGWFYHMISDAHIYDNQMDAVEEIFLREPKPFPSVYLHKDTPKDFFQIGPEHIVIDDYQAGKAIKGIPVAV